MRFIVTGGAGFIGSNITKLLLEKNHDILVLDNMHTGKKENLHHSDKLKFYQVDIRDYSLLEDHIQNIDGIFHEAGLTLVSARGFSDSSSSLADAAELTPFASRSLTQVLNSISENSSCRDS